MTRRGESGTRWLTVAEAEMSEEPEWGIRYDGNGTQALGRLEDGKRVRLVVTEQYAGQTGEPTL